MRKCAFVLLLLLLSACGGTDRADAAITCFDHLRYDQYADRPEEEALLRAAQRYVIGDDGLLYSILAAPSGEEPGGVVLLNCLDEPQPDETAPYTITIQGAAQRTVSYTLTNHGTEPLPAPEQLVLDVCLDDVWYNVWRGRQSAPTARHQRGLAVQTVPPGATEEGRFGLHESGYGDLPPAQYRLCLSDDPAQGWVIAEFVISGELEPRETVQSVPPPAERRALETFPLFAGDPARYQLCYADGWFLFRWRDYEQLLSGARQGDAYPLDCAPDAAEPSDDFTIAVEVVSADPTKLRYTITNHSADPVTLRQIRWLEVQLDGAWYRLWLGGVSQVKARERIDPGEALSETRTVRLESIPIELPAGRYRWRFLLTVGGEDVPCAATFDLPA